MSVTPVTPTKQIVLLNGATTVSTGSPVEVDEFTNEVRNFIAHVEGTGSVSATVIVEVSNNRAHWSDMATFTLSGTTSDTDCFVADESWQFVRARISAISGTGAAVTVTMGA